LFRKESLAKNISVLISGTVLAQVIPIALQPILKRMYTAEEFGVLDIYLKTLGILFVVYALKYDMGIVLPKSKVKAMALLTISVLTALLFTIISFIIVFIFQDSLLGLLQIKRNFAFILYILPLSTLFYSLYNTFNYLLIRNKKFAASSMNRVVRRGVEGGVQVGLGVIPNLKNSGLYVGDLLGNFVFFIAAFFQSFRGIKLDKRIFRPAFLWSVAKEYSDLPKYNIIPEMLNGFFGASITFIVLSKFGMLEVGLLEPTQRILAIPAAFISVSVGQVLLQRISESIAHKRKIVKDIRNISLALFAIAFSFALIIFLFGPELFAWYFGSAWKISGIYASYIVIYYSISFVTSPLGQVLIALKEFKVNAAWQVAKFIIIYLLVFVDFDSIYSFLYSYNLAGSFVYIVYGFLIIYYALKYDRKTT
jgi:O-antigen/teichoic acid export membrane protein